MTEKYVPPHAHSMGGVEAGARSAGLGSGQTAVGEEEEEVAEGIEQGGPRERAMARRWVAPITSTSATGVSAVAGGAGRAARHRRRILCIQREDLLENTSKYKQQTIHRAALLCTTS